MISWIDSCNDPTVVEFREADDVGDGGCDDTDGGGGGDVVTVRSNDAKYKHIDDKPVMYVSIIHSIGLISGYVDDMVGPSKKQWSGNADKFIIPNAPNATIQRTYCR
jgi:hypothetical protein